MTEPDQADSPDPGDPGLTPAQEAHVRRLLVEARHDAPVPQDVAARLDRVLARLHAGEGEGEDPDAALADVSDLAARRRRRVTSILAAAAAVVVLGLGLGQVVDLGGDQGSDSSSAAQDSQPGAESDPDGLGGEALGADAPAEQPSPAASSAAAPGSPQAGEQVRGLLDVRPVEIRSGEFSQDVAGVLASPAVVEDQGSAGVSPAPVDGPQGEGASFACSPADFGAGTLVPVRYDGEAAVLALRPPAGDTQVADLLQCGSGELLRSVTLPLP